MSHLFIPDQFGDCSYRDGEGRECPLPKGNTRVHTTPETQPAPNAPAPRDGSTYDDQRDEARLTRQARDVWNVVSDGRWHTLAQIAQETGHPEASISARIRDFRKERFGARNIESRPCQSSSAHEYRVRILAAV